MAQRLEDRVLETSTTTGTGSLTLAGAVTGFRTFDEAVAAADTFPYYIEAVDADGVPTGDYEVGMGTYSGSNVLARTSVVLSSNSDAAVNFGAGTKRVGLGVPAPNSTATRDLWKAALAQTLDALTDVNPSGKATSHFLRWNGTSWVPYALPIPILVAVSDETTLLTTGTAKVTFRSPFAGTLVAVRASVTEAPTGATLIVDINEAGTTVLSTKLSIDATELTSTTAASAAVISDAAIADDALMTIDIDQIGSTLAGKGLKVYLYIVPA